MDGVPPKHDALLALRTRDYRLFASGFLVANIGMQMFFAAVLWEVWQRTHDPLALGYTGLARALPVILLALPAGHAADVFDRRKLLLLTQWAFAGCALALGWASHAQAPLWITYALLALGGCVRALNSPTRNALLAMVVPPAHLQNAWTWNSGMFQFSAVVSPLLAGWIIDITGLYWPVYVCTAVGYGVFGITSTMLRPRASSVPSGKYTPRAMLAGLSHLWREKSVLGAISLDLFAVLLGGATALLPVYADTILHTDAIGYGVLRAAMPAGSVLGAVALAWHPGFRRAGRTLLWAVGGFGVVTIVFGLSAWMWLSVLSLALAGALDAVSVVIRHVLVQVRTPEHLRGRVGAVNALFIECSNELGAYESGLVASCFGAVVSVVAGGIGTIVVVGVMALALPELRRLGRLSGVDENPTP